MGVVTTPPLRDRNSASVATPYSIPVAAIHRIPVLGTRYWLAAGRWAKGALSAPEPRVAPAWLDGATHISTAQAPRSFAGARCLSQMRASRSSRVYLRSPRSRSSEAARRPLQEEGGCSGTRPGSIEVWGPPLRATLRVLTVFLAGRPRGLLIEYPECTYCSLRACGMVRDSAPQTKDRYGCGCPRFVSRCSRARAPRPALSER